MALLKKHPKLFFGRRPFPLPLQLAACSYSPTLGKATSLCQFTGGCQHGPNKPFYPFCATSLGLAWAPCKRGRRLLVRNITPRWAKEKKGEMMGYSGVSQEAEIPTDLNFRKHIE